jgi:hypothetical protein
MATFGVLLALFAILLSQISCASHASYDIDIRTHKAPGTSDADTRQVIQRSMTALQKRQDQNETSKWNATLTRSWDDATLLLSVQTPFVLLPGFLLTVR